MLKVYKVRNYVSIDGADWRRVVWSWFISTECKTSDEPLKTEHILCDASFDDAREYINNNELDGVTNDSTFWRQKPIICVRYYDAYELVSYKHLNTISYKREYEEWEDVSLKWIIENLSADQAIQYLKECGITTCPMNF